MTIPAAFNALLAYRRFVTYALIADPDRPGKTIKRPTDVRTGHYCKVNDPAHHYTHAEAAATGRPVGFVFVDTDGFWFLDIDGALQNGAWSPLAVELCAMLPGAAVEVSQSGTGLHLIGRGTVPPHACKNLGANLELYTHERFVALTGLQASGDAGIDLTPAITNIAERYFPPNPHGDIAGWTAEPVEGFEGPKDDTILIKAAIASGKKSAAAAFGGGVTFEDLWTANADVLGRKWPSSTGPYGASEADAALASHLAYWTGKNCERIRNLMFNSALLREKWTDRPEWLDITIMRAVSVVTNVAGARPAPAPPSPERLAAAGMSARDAATTFVSTTDQVEHFGGCVYIVDAHKVWMPGSGAILDKARFDVVQGGHVFPLDLQNDKVTTSAFDAFAQSQVFRAPRADTVCFRPEHAPGALVVESGWTMVNTYVPVDTQRIAGDATPFLKHLAKMLPVPHDRDIILHYMASLLQNPGAKFQWWPVIQGAEGNGKTLIDRILSFGVGTRYSHLVNPEAMAKTGNQFNEWVQGNLYLGVEEIYVKQRHEFLESFKATVTNERNAMEGKGKGQTVGDNRLNGVLFTNHREGVPINVDTRRYAIFYTAQQCLLDLERDGMLGSYFPDLYDWFFGRREYAHLGANYGYAVVNDFLHNFPLTAELDPANLCVRAPATSSTTAALRYGMSRAEQEVVEAIEEGRPGFAGGWVSSIALDRLFEAMRLPVPRMKRRALLQSLGYDHHPGLNDGRVNNIVTPDNGKPRLFVTLGHLSCNLTDPGLIGKAYTTAQNATVNSEAAARFG